MNSLGQPGDGVGSAWLTVRPGSFRFGVGEVGGEVGAQAGDGAVTVANLKDYFATYCVHPEAKSGGPDGQQCEEQTIGILRPLTIEVTAVLGRIGQETNRVTADTDLADADDLPLVYNEKLCKQCGNQVRPKQTWCGDACRKRHAGPASANAENPR